MLLFLLLACSADPSATNAPPAWNVPPTPEGPESSDVGDTEAGDTDAVASEPTAPIEPADTDAGSDTPVPATLTCHLYAGPNEHDQRPVDEYPTVPIQPGIRGGRDSSISVLCAYDPPTPVIYATVLIGWTGPNLPADTRFGANMMMATSPAPFRLPVYTNACADGPGTITVDVTDVETGGSFSQTWPVTWRTELDAYSDGDADGVPGTCDNCWDAANADQADADGDGIGDACDAPLD